MNLLVACLLSGLTYGQGGGGVPFRDWDAKPVGPKPKVACSELRALTNFEYSVISAVSMPSSQAAPEHCRVSVFVARSEERRVGKECRSRWSPYH